MNETSRQVYISYAWGGESERIVNELDADLQTRGLAVVRDKRDLGYKGSIGAFMQAIGRGHAIVVVISDKYLRSPNCMYELVEIARQPQLSDRIFPVVLRDAEIYDPVARVGYVRHWEDRIKALDEAMRSVSAANLQGLREEIDSYDQIRDSIAGLTALLKDMNTLTADMHEHSNFSSLISSLERRLQAGISAAPTAPAAPAAPAAAAATPAAPAPLSPQASAYLAGITERLTAAGYQPLKGERFGPLRFKPAFERIDKGFLANDHFRVVVCEAPGLSAERYLALAEQVAQYAQELAQRIISNTFVTGVVLTDQASEALKEAVYALPPPELGITDGCISTLVVYSAADDDLSYPQRLLDDLGSNFEANIKQFLLPD
jgi:TIR domain